MNPPRPDSPAQPPGLAAALDRLWARFLPEIEERLAVIESAAAAAQTGCLAPEKQEAAHAAAHKLAGILGSFGLAEATAPAREIEQLCAADSTAPCECGAQMASLAAALRAQIESRNASKAHAQ